MATLTSRKNDRKERKNLYTSFVCSLQVCYTGSWKANKLVDAGCSNDVLFGFRKISFLLGQILTQSPIGMNDLL
jgi:hypothetical protein